jgi:hypothetical protein
MIVNPSHSPRGKLILRSVDELNESLSIEANLDEHHVCHIGAQLKNYFKVNRSEGLFTAQSCAPPSESHERRSGNLRSRCAGRQLTVKDSKHTFVKGQGTGFATWSKMKTLVFVSLGYVSLNEDGIAL